MTWLTLKSTNVSQHTLPVNETKPHQSGVSHLLGTKKTQKFNGKSFSNVWQNGHANCNSYNLISNPRSTNTSGTLRLTPKLLSPFSHI